MKVILVHGLVRTSISMLSLAWQLSLSGHYPLFFGYSPLLESQRRILSRLVKRLRLMAVAGDEVGLIGHSFGGLLLRQACALVPELQVRHLVMLGTPNQPPRLAVRASQWLPFRLLGGSCGQCLADPDWYAQLPPVTIPYTLVAGTAGWRGRLSPFADEPNDGVVAVSETLVEPDDKAVLLPVMHTFLVNSGAVNRLVASRLQAGSG